MLLQVQDDIVMIATKISAEATSTDTRVHTAIVHCIGLKTQHNRSQGKLLVLDTYDSLNSHTSDDNLYSTMDISKINYDCF